MGLFDNIFGKGNQPSNANEASHVEASSVAPSILIDALDAKLETHATRDREETEHGWVERYDYHSDECEVQIVFEQGKQYAYVYFRSKKTYDIAQQLNMQAVVNQFNLNSMFVVASVATRQKGDGQQECLLIGNVGEPLRGSVDEMADRLSNLVQYLCFEVMPDLEKALAEAMEAEKSDDEMTRDKAFNLHVQQALSASRDARRGIDWQAERSADLSVRGLMEMCRLSPERLPLSLSIIEGDQVTQLTELADIMQFDFRALLAREKDYAERVVATLTLPASEQPHRVETLVLLFALREQTDAPAAYYQLAVSGSMPDAETVPFKTLVEVRRGGERGDYWELKYMMDDAREKTENGRESELSDEQRMANAITYPEARANLYWGRRLFRAECYGQALLHFARAYIELSSRWSELNDYGRHIFDRTCFYMGVSFLQTNRIENAIFYLNQAYNFYEPDTVEAFIAARAMMGDPTLLDFISNLHQQIHRRQTDLQLGEKTPAAEAELNYLSGTTAMLERYETDVMIRVGQLDDAESILKDMLVAETNVDFAHNRLDHIKALRAQQAEQANQQPSGQQE